MQDRRRGGVGSVVAGQVGQQRGLVLGQALAQFGRDRAGRCVDPQPVAGGFDQQPRAARSVSRASTAAVIARRPPARFDFGRVLKC